VDPNSPQLDKLIELPEWFVLSRSLGKHVISCQVRWLEINSRTNPNLASSLKRGPLLTLLQPIRIQLPSTNA
jgi:hypothetical protein